MTCVRCSGIPAFYPVRLLLTRAGVSDRSRNGVLEADEGCDDGNVTDGDGCSAACRVNLGGPCNDGGVGLTGNLSCATGVCDTTAGVPGKCEPALTCGNSVRDPGEECDDGANAPEDGCGGTCKLEVVAAGPICGDGVLEGPETCDDGNLTDDDGCSPSCVITPNGHFSGGGLGCSSTNASGASVILFGLALLALRRRRLL